MATRTEARQVGTRRAPGRPGPLRGDIRASIARHVTQRKRMDVVQGGREEWTSYEVIERFRAQVSMLAIPHSYLIRLRLAIADNKHVRYFLQLRVADL